MTTTLLPQQPSFGGPDQLADWSVFNPDTLSLPTAPTPASGSYPSLPLLTAADFHVLNPSCLQKSTDTAENRAVDPVQFHHAELKPASANNGPAASNTNDIHPTQCSRASTSISNSSSHHQSTSTTESGNTISNKSTRPQRLSKSKLYGPNDPRRERYLERNRRAATKCRRHKKERNQQLETLYRKQSAEQERLLAERDRMRSELLTLKDELLKHAQCEDPSLKSYLAHMVENIGAGSTSYSSSSSTHPITGMPQPQPQPVIFTDEEMLSPTMVTEVPWTMPAEYVDFPPM